MLHSQTLKDLEGLNPEKQFLLHNQRFVESKNDFEKFYFGFANSLKIINLLNAWLYFFRSIHECYGFEGIKQFSESNFGCPIRFSWYYEYGFNLDNVANFPKNKLLYKLLNRFLHKALLPGSKIYSLWSKLRWRFSKFVIVNIPTSIRKERKALLIEKILTCFGDYFDQYDQRDIKKCLELALPSIFYEDQEKIDSNRVLNVECAPWTFMEFSGFERILLKNRPINITGLQHGGSYHSFEPQYGRLFEESISDQFIGWGLSPGKNERQHRYKLRKDKGNENYKVDRVIWVEHCKLTIYHYFIWPVQIKQAFNNMAIEYIANELSCINSCFYSMPYPGHLKSDQYNGMRGTILESLNGNGESLIQQGDLVIFDESGSSLIHHCIEQEIPFVVVISKEDIEGFTPKQTEWFNVLRRSQLAFFDDEGGLLAKRINEGIQLSLTIPDELKEFHNKTFINI